MTTKKLIAKVLELDAKATKGDWYWYATSPSTRSVLSKVGSRSEIISSGSYNTDAELIAAYRTAAPILARMLQRAIEQRDHYHAVCYRDLEPALEDESLRKRNAELDRIAKEEG